MSAGFVVSFTTLKWNTSLVLPALSTTIAEYLPTSKPVFKVPSAA
jgi:hypothetical protein